MEEKREESQMKDVKGMEETISRRSSRGSGQHRTSKHSHHTTVTLTTDKSMPLLLVELYDFQSDNERLWVQRARWIKYEEDVEGVDHHWGRPHVPFVSLHSLRQVMIHLGQGALLLDVEAVTFGDIMHALARGLRERYELTDEAAAAFLSSMLGRMFRQPPSSERKFTVTSPTRTQATFKSSIGELAQHLNAAPASVSLIFSFMANSEEAAEPPIHASSLKQRRGTVAPSKHVTVLESTDEISRARTGSLMVCPSHLPQQLKHPDWSLKRRLSTLAHIGHSSNVEVIADYAEVALVLVGTVPEIGSARLGMIRLKGAVLLPDCHETIPVRFVFVVVGPSLPDVDYQELGRTIATLMANQAFREAAYAAQGKAELVEAIHEFMDCSVVVPPGDIQTDDLISTDDVRRALLRRKHQRELAVKPVTRGSVIRGENGKEVDTKLEELAKARIEKARSSPRRLPWERTRRPFGGLVQDIKNRLPFYLSDFKDAFHVQSISAVIFMFFVIFSPAISFGQVMNQRLDGYMGITEVFLAQCLCGVLWALLAGQPLLIQTATGPFLIFESALFQFCESKNLEFLVVRFWVSFWVLLFSILMAMVEASFLIGYVTRFTQDIFTCLIAGIFVYEAGKFIVKTFEVHPLLAFSHYCSLSMDQVDPHNVLNATVYIEELNITDVPPSHIAHMPVYNQPNTALLSMAFVIVTFYIAFVLKKIRMSYYFGRRIRKAVGDFGVPVTIFLMVMLYQYVFPDTYLREAEMPADFGLTRPDKRPWFIHPLGVDRPMPTWVIFSTIIPATLVNILLFAEIEIIELLLFSSDRGLKKPMGFHWDLVLCGGFTILCSLFGLPWMCAAAVQSLTHASSLTVMKRTAPGEKPVVDYVVEQRVTTIIVSVLIGACSFLGKVLSAIPIAVLLGVFLYLGVTCLMSIQFCHRLVLFTTPQKYFPDQPYCTEVSMWRLHLYTLIQLVGFIVLWVVNMIPQSSLAFPFVIAVDAAVRRYLLPKIFTEKELQALDPCDVRKPLDDTESVDINEAFTPL